MNNSGNHTKCSVGSMMLFDTRLFTNNFVYVYLSDDPYQCRIVIASKNAFHTTTRYHRAGGRFLAFEERDGR